MIEIGHLLLYKKMWEDAMNSDIKKFIGNKFFKMRYVTLFNKEDFPKLREPPKNECLLCKVENSTDKDYIEDLIARICDKNTAKRIKKTLTNSDCIFISARYNGEPAGCIVIIVPSEPIIYDSCKYTSNQVCFAHLYVNSNYRRKGISSYLRYSAFDYWHNHYPDRTVMGIIEESNEASLQGARKMNYRFGGINYLVKFFGRNIISITKINGKWGFLLLVGNTKYKRI